MTPEERLAEMGLTLPEMVAPLASYVPTVRHNDVVYVSGQIPMVEGKLAQSGLVGVDVSPEDAAELARRCALNAIAAIKAEVGELSAVQRVLKLTVFVASGPGFTGQPAVGNGASDLFGEVFGDAGRHARSSVGVAALPLGAPVEVECIVAVA